MTEVLQHLPSVQAKYKNGEIFYINCTKDEVEKFVEDFKTQNPNIKVVAVISFNDIVYVLYDSHVSLCSDKIMFFAYKYANDLVQIVNVSMNEVDGEVSYYIHE